MAQATRKRWVGAALGVVLLLVVGGAIVRWRKGAGEPPVTYKTVEVVRRKIVARVTASGNLQATVTVQVGAQVSGRILKLMADFNSPVKKGELIAKLDPQLFQAALEQSQANYSAAKAGVARAEAQERDADAVLKRTRALADQTLASASELQTAETGASVARAATEVARASLAQATASLNQARVNLSYTEIHSPIDGVVISRSVDVGQTVAASLQAPVLFTIAEDLRKMQVHTSVAEGDVGRIQPGMPATFTVDAFPGVRFKGQVAQIRNAAQTVQNVVTYDAVIEVENADLRLRPGMTATVTIVVDEKKGVLAIPNAALRFRPSADASEGPAGSSRGPRRRGPPGDEEKSKRQVYVLHGATPEPVTVETGLSDGMVSEVTSGELTEGDQVVVDATTPGKPTGPTSTPRMGRMF